MLSYLIRRLLWAGVLFVGVTLITYVLFFLLPADPARLAAGKSATAEDVARVVAPARARPARPRAVRPLPQAARRRPLARALVREPALGQRDGRRGRAGHDGARRRRRRSCGC